MASRLKEDEKNERIIRSLLKLTPNRRCINCNSLGPQYVCTNFWTFVCTTCSGIHREFTHRVKSVSMAKFSSQEVTALQGGGNERAKDVFFKEWDSERQSFPDSSNVDKLRDFIKHVYVDRRYTGEKRGEKPPTGRMSDESYENRKRDTYQGGSRSPPYDDTYDRRYSDRPSPGGRSDDSSSRYGERSPGYDRESKGTSDYGRSPGHPEVVNDWRRDDRFGNTQRPERTISNGDSRSEGRSPDHQKDSNVSSPVVRPVRDILGDNVIPLKIDPPKTNGVQAVDRSTHPPRVTSSGSLGSSKESPVDSKRTTLGSLIDFDSEPEPPISASTPQTIQTNSGQIAQQTSLSNDSNWASFDTGTETKVAQVPSSVNNLDSVLVQLSVPAPVSGQLSRATDNINAPTAVSASNQSFFPSGHSNTENLTSSVPRPPSNQAWNSSAASMQAPGQLLQATLRPAVQEIAPASVSQLATSEVKSSGRRELPEDIFAANSYNPSFHVPGPGWQTAPPAGMVFMMPYNTVPHPSFQQPSKSTNPFDFSNEAPAVPAPSFPSMSTLQGALPSIPSSAGLLPNSSLGAQPPAWMTPQSLAYISPVPPQASFASAMPTQVPPFASAMPTHPPSFPSAMPTQVPYFPTSTLSQAAPFAPAMTPGTFMGQQAPQHMIPSRYPSGGGFAGGGAVYGSFNQNQLMSGGFSSSTTPNASPAVGGNPFG